MKVKMCGLTREEDIEAANAVRPEYIGFVFAKKSRRYIDPAAAGQLRKKLDPSICAVGVFVDEHAETVAALLNEGIIDIAQLHGQEDDAYIRQLKKRTEKPLIKAFRIRAQEDIQAAQRSTADLVLLDAGAGDGKTFDWALLEGMKRPFFLAGGLEPENIREIQENPFLFALDVSSGIETNGQKDIHKMAAFRKAAGKEGTL